MKYIIIGLGNYGSCLAEELSLLGHEVIGVDSSENRVEQMKDKFATSFVLDTTDEQALQILPLLSVDKVIVTIGEAFGDSIKTVALLKKFGVKQIYARAIDQVHRTVLEAFNLNAILAPERDAARALVHLIDLHIKAESFQVDKEHYIMKFEVPKSLIGYNVNDTALKKEFNLTTIALIKSKTAINCSGISICESEIENVFDIDYPLTEGDQLVCYGKYKDFIGFWKAV